MRSKLGLHPQCLISTNPDSVEFLLQKVGALNTHSKSQPFTIIELGAGTGKFTRAVLRVFDKNSVKNAKIIPTDPMKEMCEKFKEMVPNMEIHQRRADNLRKHRGARWAW